MEAHIKEAHVRELKQTIKSLHGVESDYVETVPIKETYEGKTVWEGDVEVFDLHGHPKTTRAYAWMHRLDDSESKRHVIVLQIPPVTSPQSAVRAVIVHEYRQQKK